MYLLLVHSLNTLSFLWHKLLLIFHTALSLQPSSLPRLSDSLSCILDNLTLCPTNILHQIIRSISHLIHMNQVISKLSKPGLWVCLFILNTLIHFTKFNNSLCFTFRVCFKCLWIMNSLVSVLFPIYLFHQEHSGPVTWVIPLHSSRLTYGATVSGNKALNL